MVKLYLSRELTEYDKVLRYSGKQGRKKQKNYCQQCKVKRFGLFY